MDYINMSTNQSYPASAQPSQITDLLEVPAQVQMLRVEAEEIAKVAAQLEARFDRILRPTAEQAGSQSEPSGPIKCPMGSELADIRAMHHAALNTLQSILNRAEL